MRVRSLGVLVVLALAAIAGCSDDDSASSVPTTVGARGATSTEAIITESARGS